ncbi:hypothetical protein O9993_03020 [Vibrio lentus]|nr:hypothetical protein [Vibrio lentus]
MWQDSSCGCTDLLRHRRIILQGACYVVSSLGGKKEAIKLICHNHFTIRELLHPISNQKWRLCAV